MKKFLVALCGGLLFAVGSLAQVSVEIEFDQQQFLPYESMVASVRIVNYSGRTLKLGASEGWLAFAVEGEKGAYVPKLGDPPVIEAFDLPSSARATRRADLAPYFDMAKPGRYLIKATVKAAELEQEVTSAAGAVHVVMGTQLWEQEFGMPRQPGRPQDEQSEVRKYSLLQFMGGKQVRLYARVSDQFDAKVYRVFPIGPLLSFNRPEAQVDKFARLHVLFQTGARAFTYVVIRPDGQLVAQQTHQYTGTRPSLRVDSEGAISVRGGMRVFSSSDLPKTDVTDTNAPAPSLPQSTNKVDQP